MSQVTLNRQIDVAYLSYSKIISFTAFDEFMKSFYLPDIAADITHIFAFRLRKNLCNNKFLARKGLILMLNQTWLTFCLTALL